MSVALAGPALANGNGNGNGKANNKAIADIDVEYTSCSEAEIVSSKDISNIVIELDNGDIIKIEDVDSQTYALDMGENIANIWVKSGANGSGDGPGYGEKFESEGGSALVEVYMTADDVQSTFINGALQSHPNDDHWGYPSDYAVEVSTCDPIVIAVNARDNFGTAAAVIGLVKVDGQVVSRTGDGQWKVTTNLTDPNWTEQSYDDSAWATAPQCGGWIPWGTYYQNLWGSDWIWHSTNCRDYQDVFLRLTLEP